MHKYIYKAGASGILTGNYLTTKGRDLSDDNKTIKEMGLEQEIYNLLTNKFKRALKEVLSRRISPVNYKK